jgi:hypothetical protein
MMELSVCWPWSPRRSVVSGRGRIRRSLPSARASPIRVCHVLHARPARRGTELGAQLIDTPLTLELSPQVAGDLALP